MPKRRAEEQYEDDGGFVEDAPKSKKSKGVKADGGMQQGADGEVYWEISNKKRLTVSEFKKTTLINIREYYEKDGKMMPGKGTALNTEQLNAVITLLPDLESVLKSKGFKDIARPNYANASKKPVDDEGEEEEEEAVESGADESDEAEAPSKKSKSKLDKFKHKTKKNHEATSDEDDD
ncbi:putative RNA polymerase II transcriptional coactivator [Pseudocercospora fuligena]|uniref:Putative RNA polymerase II transcriptional coactivator n=1 Tax=Pseudocercospora fuligena TaxID=685502 RepID=A0A8H6R4K7_9PEZI|nr:putative RNA polymerase II transcriptional coactivator [Pseudocercospora fuligena]